MMKLYTHTQRVGLCAACPNVEYSALWMIDRGRDGTACLCDAGKEPREVPDEQTIPEWCPLPDVEGD